MFSGVSSTMRIFFSPVSVSISTLAKSTISWKMPLSQIAVENAFFGETNLFYDVVDLLQRNIELLLRVGPPDSSLPTDNDEKNGFPLWDQDGLRIPSSLSG